MRLILLEFAFYYKGKIKIHVNSTNKTFFNNISKLYHENIPVIYDEYARVIPQEGVYAVIWFNDSDEIRPKLRIWSAHTQYIVSRIWESASSFCCNAFGNNRVHNNFRNNGHPLYYELDKVFEDAKTKCPIKIIGRKEPIDFNELEMFVKNLNSNPK